MRSVTLSDGSTTLLDDETLVMLGDISIHRISKGYAAVCLFGKTCLLHHIVIGKPIRKDLEVDHIDGNRLNNQKHNLRVIHQKENARKCSGKKTYGGAQKSSRFKGVCFDKQTGRWRSGIKVDYRRINLGRYDAEEDAALAYNHAAKKYFGEFAILNDV